jgi:hypothetical protein
MYAEAVKKLDDTRKEVNEKNARIARASPEQRKRLDDFNQQMARSNPEHHLHDYKMDQYYQKDMNEKFAYGSFIDTHFRQEVQLFTQVCGLTNSILAITEVINASLPPPNPPALNDANRQYVLGMFWQRVHPLFGRLHMVELRDETRLVQTHFTLDQLVGEVCTSANLNQVLHSFQTDIQAEGIKSPQTQFLVGLANQIERIKTTGLLLSKLSYVPVAAGGPASPVSSPVQTPPAAAGLQPSPVSPQGYPIQSPQSSGQGSPVAGLGSPVAGLGSPVAGLSGSAAGSQLNTSHLVQQQQQAPPETPRPGYQSFGQFAQSPSPSPHLGPQSFGPQSGYPQSGYPQSGQPSFGQSFAQDDMGMGAGSKKTRTKRSAHKRSAHKHKRSVHKHKRSVHKHKRSSRKHK